MMIIKKSIGYILVENLVYQALSRAKPNLAILDIG